MGGHGSGRKTGIFKIMKSQEESRVPIVPTQDTMFLPNLSGDHSRGRVRTTPTTDLEIANKKHVDDQVGAGDTTLANTKIWIGDSGGTKQEFALSGDMTMTAGGVISFVAGIIVNADINASAAIARTKLANVDVVDDTTPELGGEMDAGAHTIGFTQQSQTGDGTTTIDWKLGNKDFHTFGAQDETFVFTAPTNPCNILLVLKQDSTGSRVVTWPSAVKWPGGTAPTLTTAANSIDIISFYYDGTSYYGVETLNFS